MSDLFVDLQDRCVEWLYNVSSSISMLKRTVDLGLWASFRAALLELMDMMSSAQDGAAWVDVSRRIEAINQIYGIDHIFGNRRYTPRFRGLTTHSGDRTHARVLEAFTPDNGEAYSLSRVMEALADQLDVTPSPVEVRPHVSIEQPAARGATIRIEVAVLTSASSTAVHAGSLASFGAFCGDIDVEVMLPEGDALQAATPLTASLRVPKKQDSITLVFKVRAARHGTHKVQIAFRQKGVTLHVVEREIVVQLASKAAESPAFRHAEDNDSRPLAAPRFFLAPPRAHGLVLHVQRTGADLMSHYYRVTLTGDHTMIPSPLSEIITTSPQAMAQLSSLCMDLYANIKHCDARARVSRIHAIGSQIGEALLPESIRIALTRARIPEGTSLHIESEDAWVPWEMIAVGNHRTGFFLAERFAITRWLRLGSIRPTLHAKTGVLIAPRTSGFKLEKERSALTSILGGEEPIELCELSDVQVCLEPDDGSAAYSFFHFACHGLAEPKAPLGARLILDDGDLRPIDIRPLSTLNTTSMVDNACVFINACEGGIPCQGMFCFAGWANAFLAAGAAAVIAPSWAIQDNAASVFAERFYKELIDRKTVGEAARLARLAVRRHDYPDWLAFAAYAAPYTLLV